MFIGIVAFDHSLTCYFLGEIVGCGGCCHPSLVREGVQRFNAGCTYSILVYVLSRYAVGDGVVSVPAHLPRA